MLLNVLVVAPDHSIGDKLVSQANSLPDTRVFHVRSGMNDDLAMGSVRSLLATEHVDEMWTLSGSLPAYASDLRSIEAQKLLRTMQYRGLQAFNHVIPASVAPSEVMGTCREFGLAYRSFSTTQLLGPDLNGHGENFWLSHFLAALDELKSEIEERWAQYFEHQALRYGLPSDTPLNLVHVDQFVERMFQLAGRDETADKHFHIANRRETRWDDLCEQLGMIYDLGLIPSSDKRRANSVDRLFESNLTNFPAFKYAAGERKNIEYVLLDEQEELEILRAIRESQKMARTNRNARAATIPSRLTKATIDDRGSILSYFVGGEGDVPIVILNALGHGLSYWHRLLDLLLRRHRVVIPEPRRPTSPSHSWSIADQVNDLEIVLRHANVTRCHLLGWCTGPKVAVAFYKRQPSNVASMVLLNGSFKCSDRPGEFDTPYEHNLEHLCRSLLDQPEMVDVVMKAFQSNANVQHADLFHAMSGEELATAVLSETNEALKQQILMPFRSKAATLSYARQILEFLAYDAVADASRVSVPVLLVSAEYDSVASPETADLLAQVFPRAQSVNILGATHYCIYDRPQLIATIIEKFLPDFANVYSITADAQRLLAAEQSLWT